MARTELRGFAELAKLFDTLPADVETDLKVEIPKAAATILAIEKGDVPIRTGDLWRGLAIQSLDDGLKVRAGLVNTIDSGGKIKRSSLFYGRIVEFGRKGQTVMVERRRRVGGRLRTFRGRKIAADLYKAYPMDVAPLPARPFVDTPETEAVMFRTMETIADIIQGRLEE